MATLKEAISIARNEPNSERSIKLMAAIHAGKMDAAAVREGIDLTKFKEVTKAKMAPTGGAAGLVKAVVENASPASLIQKGIEVLPTIAKAGAAAGNSQAEKLTPEQIAEREQGKTQETERLAAATQKLNTQGVVPKSENTLGEREDAVQQLKNIDTNRYGAMAGGEFGKGIAEGATETMMNLSQAPSKMAEGVTEVLVGSDKGKQFQREQINKMQKDLTTSNSFLEGAGKTAERIGEFMLPGSNVDKAAKAIKGSEYLAKLPPLTQKLMNFGARVGLDAGAAGTIAAAQEGELNQNVANSAMIAGAFSAGSQILGGLKNALFKKPELQKELLRNGMKEQDVNLLKKLNPEQSKIATQYIDDGLNRLENADAPRVFQRPADEIDDFMKQVDDLRAEKGRMVGKLKEPLINKTVELPDRAKIWLDTKNTLKDYNAISSKGKLQLERSDLARSPEVVSFLDDVSSQLTAPGKTTPLTYRDLESLNKQAGSIIQKLSSDGVSTSDPAVRVLRTLKDSLDDAVSNLSPELKAAKQEFSALVKLQDQVSSASKVKIGPGQYANDNKLILEGILQKRDMKWQEAINAMDDIEKNFGIPAPKDLTTKARLAAIAENLTGSNQSRSMQGLLEGSLPGKTGAIIDTLKTVKQHFAPTEAIKNQATKILGILDKAVLNGEKVVLEPSKAKQLLDMVVKYAPDLAEKYVIQLPTSGSNDPK